MQETTTLLLNLMLPIDSYHVTDELKEKMKAMYKVSESSETKLVSSFASSSYDDMTESTPLGEVVSQKQFVVIVEREGKSWPNINQYKNISGSNSMWTGVPSSSKYVPCVVSLQRHCGRSLSSYVAMLE